MLRTSRPYFLLLVLDVLLDHAADDIAHIRTFKDGLDPECRLEFAWQQDLDLCVQRWLFGGLWWCLHRLVYPVNIAAAQCDQVVAKFAVSVVVDPVIVGPNSGSIADGEVIFAEAAEMSQSLVMAFE